MISPRLRAYPLSYLLFFKQLAFKSSLVDPRWHQFLHFLSKGFASASLVPKPLPALSAAALALTSLSFLCQPMYSCHLKVCRFRKETMYQLPLFPRLKHLPFLTVMRTNSIFQHRNINFLARNIACYISR